jgi:hypothetical protein
VGKLWVPVSRHSFLRGSRTTMSGNPVSGPKLSATNAFLRNGWYMVGPDWADHSANLGRPHGFPTFLVDSFSGGLNIDRGRNVLEILIKKILIAIANYGPSVRRIGPYILGSFSNLPFGLLSSEPEATAKGHPVRWLPGPGS